MTRNEVIAFPIDSGSRAGGVSRMRVDPRTCCRDARRWRRRWRELMPGWSRLEGVSFDDRSATRAGVGEQPFGSSRSSRGIDRTVHGRPWLPRVSSGNMGRCFVPWVGHRRAVLPRPSASQSYGYLAVLSCMSNDTLPHEGFATNASPRRPFRRRGRALPGADSAAGEMSRIARSQVD